MLALPAFAPDFGYSEDHALLQQSARRFLSERFDRAALRRLYEKPAEGKLAAREVAELGWQALTTDPAHGGGGLGYLHAALLCEELGRALFPVPVAACVLAAEMLARGGEGDLASRIASGELCGAVAFGDGVTAQETKGGWTVRGEHRGIVAGADVVVARGGSAWFAVETRGVERKPERTVDATRATARMHYADAPARRLALDDDYLPRALVLVAAECCGAAETALTVTRDYARDRQQFGRPIGTYQAVSHPIVNTMIELEQARSLMLAAAATIDASSDADIPARMAKAAACDALWNAAARGVQLHGGFGFTWDCDMHFFFRRAIHDKGALGDPAHHRRVLAEKLFAF